MLSESLHLPPLLLESSGAHSQFFGTKWSPVSGSRQRREHNIELELEMPSRGQERCRQESVRGCWFGLGVRERDERERERKGEQERTPWMEGIIRPQGKITDGHLRERERECV